VSRWSAALTQAGIRDPYLRQDYDVQRKLVRRYRREEYLAARLLLPDELCPHVMAAGAFMHETDRRIDRGDLGARSQALRAWTAEVTSALRGEESEQGTLRALADTARRHPHMAQRVRDFLDGAPVDASWCGFDSESELQEYVDRYSAPALMLTACLIGPLPGAEAHELFEQGCHRLIEAMQRTDFLADLHEDLQQGQIGIPRDALLRHGVDVEDLRSRPQACRPAVCSVVDAQVALAEEAFSQSRSLPALVERSHQPFLRALIAVQELRLQAVRANRDSLLLKDVSPPAPAAVQILWREYRAFEKHQR
jgi:phytoene synthase